MARFPIKIKSSAAKALARVPCPDRARIVEAIDRLADEPFAGGVLKGEFSGLRRLRVGAYRVVYEVVDDRLLVLVIRVGHRGRVYR